MAVLFNRIRWTYDEHVFPLTQGWGVFTTAGTTGIHYCLAVPDVSSAAIHRWYWYPLPWAVPLVSSTAIHCWYPLLLGCASGAGLCGGDVVSDQILVEVVDYRFSSDKLCGEIANDEIISTYAMY